jgi:hypothetical protein
MRYIFFTVIGFVVSSCSSVYIPYEPSKPLFKLVNIAEGGGTCKVLYNGQGQPFVRNQRNYGIYSKDCPKTLHVNGYKISMANNIIAKAKSADVVWPTGTITFYRKTSYSYGTAWRDKPL